MFTIHKHGKTKFHFLEGNQCGLAGQHEFKWEFIASGDKLDDRQFLVDHFEVEDAIEDRARTTSFRGSCEQLAVALGLIVLWHTPVKLRSLVVRLTGKSGTTIQFDGDFEAFNPAIEMRGRTHAR